MRFSMCVPKAVLAALVLVGALSLREVPAPAQQPSAAAVAPVVKPETVEWVYRIRYGYHDEWFQIFRKYQIAILERQKQLGYVKEFTVWAPGLHTDENSRWDYRVEITRASHDAPSGQSEDEVARQIFPDQDTFHREENRRWELTTNHWDLPIHVVNLNASK